jgi:hypothetical protein
MSCRCPHQINLLVDQCMLWEKESVFLRIRKGKHFSDMKRLFFFFLLEFNFSWPIFLVFIKHGKVRKMVSEKWIPRNKQGINITILSTVYFGSNVKRYTSSSLTIIMSFSRLLFASLVAFCLATFASGASRLPDDEGIYVQGKIGSVILEFSCFVLSRLFPSNHSYGDEVLQ